MRRARSRDEELAGVDLSPLALLRSTAPKPVLPDTLERFAKRFAPYGFRPEAMRAGYGLAEPSVALAFPPLGRWPLIDRIERETFERRAARCPAAPGDARV